MTPPRSAFGAPPQGGAARGPAEPDPQRPLEGAATAGGGPLISIQDLRVDFRMGKLPPAQAVRGVSFDIDEHSTVALVGESGSGKSVTAMSIVNLLPDNARRSGRILYGGRDLLQAGADAMRALRGREIACVF